MKANVMKIRSIFHFTLFLYYYKTDSNRYEKVSCLFQPLIEYLHNLQLSMLYVACDVMSKTWLFGKKKIQVRFHNIQAMLQIRIQMIWMDVGLVFI